MSCDFYLTRDGVVIDFDGVEASPDIIRFQSTRVQRMLEKSGIQCERFENELLSMFSEFVGEPGVTIVPRWNYIDGGARLPLSHLVP